MSKKDKEQDPLGDDALDSGAHDEHDDMGDETLLDIAPIGPTEVAGARHTSVAPESPAEEAQARSSPSVEQLEQQIRDLEARLDEMIGQSRAPSPRSESAG